MQRGHEIENVRFDMIHLEEVDKLEVVVLHVPLLESLEGRRHRRAVVGLRLKLAHRHARIADQQYVFNRGEIALDFLHRVFERQKSARLNVVLNVAPETIKPTRLEIGRPQILGEL